MNQINTLLIGGYPTFWAAINFLACTVAAVALAVIDKYRDRSANVRLLLFVTSCAFSLTATDIAISISQTDKAVAVPSEVFINVCVAWIFAARAYKGSHQPMKV